MKVINVNETDSTNKLIKELIKQGESNFPFIVQTDFQTAGKGQFNNTWESLPKQNLLFSIALKIPEITIEHQFKISKLVAVALREVIGLYNDKVCIKWPNDIYVDDKKIAGILIENTITGSKIDYCIIGIGLNVNQTEFSKKLPNPTSLKLLKNRDFEIQTLREQIVDKLLFYTSQLFLLDEIYLKYLYRKGELSQFRQNNNDFLGVIVGVNSIGKLLVRVVDRKIQSFANREIKFILPETN